MTKIKIAVLMGGNSPEHEVSLASGENVMKNLNSAKYEILPIKITKGNKWIYEPLRQKISGERQEKEIELIETIDSSETTNQTSLILETDAFITEKESLKKVDVVFNALHGEYGEDGAIQGVLEFLGAPYTGSGVLASALGMNKIKSRELFKQAGLLTPSYVVLIKEKYLEKPGLTRKIIARINFPVVVKPACLGSSVGISIVKERNGLEDALKKSFENSREILIEDYINGREMTCGVLENFNGEKISALPVTEIIPPAGRFFDYEVKYNGRSQEITPAKIDPDLSKKIQKTAKEAHQILGCRHYSRVDMIVKDREVYVLEINTLPGLTEASLFPQAAKAAGLEFPKLLDHLIGLALKSR